MSEETERALREMVELDPGGIAETMDAIFVAAHRARKIEALTDVELASVLDRTADATDMFSATNEVLRSAASRLRRASKVRPGGPYRECTFCENEGTIEQGDGPFVCEEHRGMS